MLDGWLLKKLSRSSILALALYIVILLPYTLFHNGHIKIQNETIEVRKINNQSLSPPHTQLCVIVRTYHGQYDYLLLHLLSLSANQKYRPKVFVTITDAVSSFEIPRNITRIVNALVGYNMSNVLDIPYTRHPTVDNDYGYHMTDLSLEYLLKTTTADECSYFMFTNGDNFYVKGILDNYVGPAMSEGLDLISFSFISHYIWDWTGGQESGPLYYNNIQNFPIYAEFRLYGIDLGAGVFARQLIKSDDFRFMKMDLSQTHLLDGLFIAKASEATTNKRIYRQLLLMHQ